MKGLLIAVLLFSIGCGGGSDALTPQGPVIESDTDGYRTGEYEEISEEQERIYEENYKNYHGSRSPSSYYGTMEAESTTVDAPTYSPPKNRIKKYMPQPVYNTRTGRTEWVNPMPFTVEENRRPTYMNYNTGEVYVPLQGPGNFYMNSGGDLIQPY